MDNNCSYILSCCSTADVSKEYLDSKNIKYVCFHYSLDEETFADDFYQSIGEHEFYQKMVDGAMTKTSQVNVDEFINYFTPFLEQGLDILHITLSSGISGVLNSAQIAAEDLREQFPDRKIIIIDSLTASSGYGLLMDKLAKLRDNGATIDELEKWTLENRKFQNVWFITTDLTFFIRGGRVSKVSGWFGTALNICPLLNVNIDGKLIPRSKCRGKKMAKKSIASTVVEWAKENEDYEENIFITESDCYEDAKEVADMITAALPNMSEPIQIFPIGTTIGSHTGPGTIAVGFWGKEKQV